VGVGSGVGKGFGVGAGEGSVGGGVVFANGVLVLEPPPQAASAMHKGKQLEIRRPRSGIEGSRTEIKEKATLGQGKRRLPVVACKPIKNYVS
jgi:hypothetical protein